MAGKEDNPQRRAEDFPKTVDVPPKTSIKDAWMREHGGDERYAGAVWGSDLRERMVRLFIAKDSGERNAQTKASQVFRAIRASDVLMDMSIFTINLPAQFLQQKVGMNYELLIMPEAIDAIGKQAERDEPDAVVYLSGESLAVLQDSLQSFSHEAVVGE